MERRRASRSVTRPVIRIVRAVGLTAAVVAGVTGSPVLGAASDAGAERTALDLYVAKPDPAYRFSRVSVIAGEGYTAHVLDLVSQQWRNSWEVDRTEWHHWLTIVVPDRVRHQTALLWIGGMLLVFAPLATWRYRKG